MITFALWPDGTICEYEYLNEYPWMSDDYEIVEAESEDEALEKSFNCGRGAII